MVPGPTACDACLRRTLLVDLLAPYIERIAMDRRGRSAPELLSLGDEKLARAAGGEKGLAFLRRASATPARELRRLLTDSGVWACCRHHHAYPPRLRDSREAPALLTGVGDHGRLGALAGEPVATVVGSRRASSYGRGAARELGQLLAASEVIVVSGMALGIDAKAHRGALDGAGLTVAVLGGGPETSYPPRQARLHGEICEAGLVLSEALPGASSWRWRFPARNRIMAALGGVTVVVEAAAHSGSLITAGMAADLGRTVGAVPGPINSWLSAGTNNLLADGALVVRGAEDVLDALLGPGRRAPNTGAALEPGLRAVLERVERGERTPDAVATDGGAGAAEAAAALARLELMGYVRSDASGRYERTLLSEPEASRP